MELIGSLSTNDVFPEICALSLVHNLMPAHMFYLAQQALVSVDQAQQAPCASCTLSSHHSTVCAPHMPPCLLPPRDDCAKRGTKRVLQSDAVTGTASKKLHQGDQSGTVNIGLGSRTIIGRLVVFQSNIGSLFTQFAP